MARIVPVLTLAALLSGAAALTVQHGCERRQPAPVAEAPDPCNGRGTEFTGHRRYTRDNVDGGRIPGYSDATVCVDREKLDKKDYGSMTRTIKLAPSSPESPTVYFSHGRSSPLHFLSLDYGPGRICSGTVSGQANGAPREISFFGPEWCGKAMAETYSGPVCAGAMRNVGHALGYSVACPEPSDFRIKPPRR